MDIFHIEDLVSQSKKSENDYLEFLRVSDLSMGLYSLKAGQTDPQSPHNEDEVYYVIAGMGRIEVGAEIQDVRPGSIIYVPAKVAHKFLDISEELQVLVFFAPAES